jgi:hypothetical protein
LEVSEEKVEDNISEEQHVKKIVCDNPRLTVILEEGTT